MFALQVSSTFGLAVPVLSLALAAAAPLPQSAGPPAEDPRQLATFAGTLRSVGFSNSEPLDGINLALTTTDRRVVYRTVTDADGRFTFTKVRSGQYYVVVVRDGYTFQVDRVALRPGTATERSLRKGIEIAGAVTDERGAPVAGMTVCALERDLRAEAPRYVPRLRTLTDARGHFVLGPGADATPGVYIVAAMPTGCDLKVLRPADRLLLYPPTYAPGTTRPTEASELTVDARMAASVSLRLKPGPTTRVEGRLIGYVNTTVVPGQMVIEPEPGPVSIVRTVQITSDGAFAISGLTAGTYRLVVPTKYGPDPLKWATQQVTVATEPVKRLIIPMQSTMAIGGQIDFAGHLAMLYGTQVFLTVNATRVGDRSDLRGIMPDAWCTVLPDGKFALGGLMPGQYVLSVFGAETWGWHTKSAIYDGPPGGRAPASTDLFDLPITIETGKNVFGLTIQMTYLSTTVTGRVEDAVGKPPGDAVVIVFSQDARYWSSTRRTQIALVDRAGAFTIAGLPQGDYLAVVQSRLAGRPTPAQFEQLRGAAVAFSLPDGGTKELALRLK